MIVASLVVICVLVGLLFGYQHRVQTAESIEFLESGVILRVTPSVDDRGQIMLEVHPEVSNGTVDANGIPSQTTPEVTTRPLVPNGQTVFLGGLIRHTSTQNQQRVPVLGRIPGLRKIFGNEQATNIITETIILITPRIVDDQVEEMGERQADYVAQVESELAGETLRIEPDVIEVFGPPYEADAQQD